MLRTISVRQSPPLRTAPHRFGSALRANPPGQRSSSRHRLRFGPLLLGLCLCLAGVAVYIWPRVQVVRLAYRLQASEHHLRNLLQTHDQLRSELASLKDPARVYRVATEQLGMGTPRHDQVVIVTRGPQPH
jgi:cell division protein FtsL